jgi:hypothetical protein
MRILTILLALVLRSSILSAQGVGIGTTTPASSARKQGCLSDVLGIDVASPLLRM